MKCMASRVGSPGEADDKADIRLLLKHLALPSPAAALEVIGRYYPPEQTPLRAKYLLEEIFAQKE